MAHRKASKGNCKEEIKGDGIRCVLRTSSPRVGLTLTVGFSPTPSPPQKRKRTLEEEEGELEDGALDKGARRQALVRELGGLLGLHTILGSCNGDVSQVKVKVFSSRRQESHVQRRRVTGAGAGARRCGPTTPRSLERARREMSHLYPQKTVNGFLIITHAASS